MEITNTLLISISITMILYYIYETNVIWEYLNKLSDILNFNVFKNFFYGKLLLKAYEPNGTGNYIAFINSIYNTFFTRLISCPICFGFWLSLLFALFTDIIFIGIYSFLSLTFYFLIKILTNISAKL